MEFYDKNTVKNIIIDYPDIYFTPEYGQLCEYSNNALWEICCFKDLIYVYLKQPYEFEHQIYYDLISPYGYSGYFYKHTDTFQEFIILFREKSKDKNYITEVVKQSPYLNLDYTVLNINYEVITTKSIFAVKINDWDIYFKNKLNSSTRNIIRKGDKLHYSYQRVPLSEKILNDFIEMYTDNMNKLNASQYYYFNTEYYSHLETLNDSYLVNVYDETNKIIGSSIIFSYKNFIHYHLSCNDKSSNCITNYLLNQVIQDLGINKQVILGGGIKENDSLFKFKRNIATNSHCYTIYKNILNLNVYNKICKIKNLTKIENEYFPIYRNNIN